MRQTGMWKNVFRMFLLNIGRNMRLSKKFNTEIFNHEIEFSEN